MPRGEHWDVDGPQWRMPRSFTLWAPVVISFIAQVPASIAISRYLQLSLQLTLATVGLALVGPLALIFARRFPGPVVAIVSVAAAADLFTDVRFGPPYVSLAFALLSALVRRARIWAFVSIAVCWVATITLSFVVGYRWEPARIAAVTIGILVVVGIGEAMRGRRERFRALRTRRRQQQHDALQAERVRIARELHDVLAHSLSSINVQAGVGLHLLKSRPEQAESSLLAIKDTSKQALDEVRAVLGVLRSEDGGDAPLLPTADLSRLGALVDDARLGGLDATLAAPSWAELSSVPQSTQAAVYRIAQEALTNVRRHSGASRVRLELRFARHSGGAVSRDDARPDSGVGRDAAPRAASESQPDLIVLTVTDDGRGRAGAPEGRGLLGMRERAELLGGELRIADADPGFRVEARIPIPMPAPADSPGSGSTAPAVRHVPDLTTATEEP
ncbi:sensor histidine kinase [Schumannella soli]|uniref:histidine kinase n=1 Tax=Schumannella soli TaxID=2590779 RepID=A0A506Y2H7_9MICO|nr:sensor histidine kinase [Schumannella soli]TPW76113.1 sensor histidine kinase [Schumannella soli]